MFVLPVTITLLLAYRSPLFVVVPSPWARRNPLRRLWPLRKLLDVTTIVFVRMATGALLLPLVAKL